MLISHSNAEDIGLMVGRIAMMSTRLLVDVFAWDYAGYGRSDGFCSEQRLYDDVERIYDFMTTKMKIPAKEVNFF